MPEFAPKKGPATPSKSSCAVVHDSRESAGALLTADGQKQLGVCGKVGVQGGIRKFNELKDIALNSMQIDE